jgi:hypothetical protein
MSGLPRKYAKMGFKRGWAAYKRRRGLSKTVKRVRRKMSRRKRSRARRYASKAKNFMSGRWGHAISAALYGAVRTKLEPHVTHAVQQIPYIGDKIPADKVDNAGFLALCLFAHKIPLLNRIPHIRKVCNAGWQIEWAMLGAEMATRGFSVQ